MRRDFRVVRNVHRHKFAPPGQRPSISSISVLLRKVRTSTHPANHRRRMRSRVSRGPRRPLVACTLITSNRARKPVGKPVGNPVRKPLADLGCNPLPDGASHGLPLLGRNLGEPLGNPVREPLPQLVRDPFPNDAAKDGPLLRCELGKPVRKTFADLARHSFTLIPEAMCSPSPPAIRSASRSESPSRTSAASLCLMVLRNASRCSGLSWERASAILSASLSRISSARVSLMTAWTMARCSGVSVTAPVPSRCICAAAVPTEMIWARNRPSLTPASFAMRSFSNSFICRIVARLFSGSMARLRTSSGSFARSKSWTSLFLRISSSVCGVVNAVGA